MTEPGEKIALCLSGGGFRATLFHLGVVRALAEKGLLENVTHISSVSGGSILGAHLVLNWSKYCDINKFEEPVEALLRFVQSDVRGRITRRYPATLLLRMILWPVDWLLRLVPFSLEKPLEHLTTTSWLVRYYRKGLYGTRTLADLAPGEDLTLPTIDILGTNLTQADVCSFSPDGFRTRPGLEPDVRGDPKDIEVCEAVAASSAFPGFFAPLHLRRSRIEWSLKENFDRDHPGIPDVGIENLYISDAGIYGNLGSRGLAEFREEINADLSHRIVSDAGAHVDWDITNRMQYVLPSVLRIMNIVVQLKEEPERLRLENEKDTVIIELNTPSVDKNRVDEFLPLNKVRTDLDRFSNTEIVCLVQDGYAKTIKACCDAGLSDSAATLDREWPLQLLRAGPRQRLDAITEQEEIRRAAGIQWGFLRFLSDPGGVILSLVPLVMIAVLGALSYLFYEEALQKEAQLSRKNYVRGAVSTRLLEVPKFDYVVKPLQGEPSLPPLIEDNKIFDLTDWNVTPTSKVTMRRALKFAPFDKAQKLEALAFRVETTGTDVYLEGDTPNSIVNSLTSTGRAAQKETKLREIFFLLRDLEPTGARRKWWWPQVEKTYDLSYRATYHDAFRAKDQWWVGSRVRAQTEKMSILLMFSSKSHPDKGSLKCLVETTGKRDETCSTSVEYPLGEDRGMLAAYWETKEPKIGSIYKLQWTWKLAEVVKKEVDKALKKSHPNAAETEKALIAQTAKLGKIEPYLSEPTYDEFRFRSDIRVLDLRSWTKAQKGKKYASAVRLHRELLIVKEGDPKVLRFRTRTTGNDVHVQCPLSYLPNNCQIYADDQNSDQNARAVHVRDLVLNVSNEPSSQDLELEYETTFFEAFQHEDQWWYEFWPESPTTTVLLILFPEDRPFDVVRCGEVGKAGSQSGCKDFGRFIKDTARQYVYLETAPREKEVGIRVEWEF